MRATQFNEEACEAFEYGDFRAAERAARAALEHATRDQDRVCSLINLSETLCQLGRAGEAEGWAREAVALADPEDRPQALRTLGGCLADLRRFGSALLALEEAAAVPRPMAGTLLSLGDVYYELGRFEEALRVYDQIEAIGVHGTRASALASNRAAVLAALGRDDEAEELHRKALVLQELATGPDHYEVVPPLENLAVTLLDRGARAEALQLVLRARAIKERHFGPEHPRLSRSWELEAKCRQDERLLEKAMRLAGKDPLQLVQCERGLACLVARNGRWDEAAAAERRCIDILSEVLGPHHPSTLQARFDLGYALRMAGHLQEAEQELMELLVLAPSGGELEAEVLSELGALETKSAGSA